MQLEEIELLSDQTWRLEYLFHMPPASVDRSPLCRRLLHIGASRV